MILLYLATAVCLAGQLLDWYSTKWGISKGGKEVSAFPAWMLKHVGIWGLFAVKALLGVAPLLLSFAISLPTPLAIIGFCGGVIGATDAYHNYVKMKKYSASILVYAKITDKSMSSLPVYIYKNSKKLSAQK